MTEGSDQAHIEGIVARLVEARGWECYHTPAQLVPALLVECSELMQACLWRSPDEIDELFRSKDPYVVRELADIAINFYSIIRYCGLDVAQIVEEKVDELLVRYADLGVGEHR